jgi:hypothetical protein
MVITFKYKQEASPLFGTIYRPIADVLLQNRKTGRWQPVTMLVDSGADYTLLPRWYTVPLGVDLARDCEQRSTTGVGGAVEVYLFRHLLIQVGPWKRNIPVGFLAGGEIPPLLGRQGCLDSFTITLARQQVYFTEQLPTFE